jgi:hypothetical protein
MTRNSSCSYAQGQPHYIHAHEPEEICGNFRLLMSAGSFWVQFDSGKARMAAKATVKGRAYLPGYGSEPASMCCIRDPCAGIPHACNQHLSGIAIDIPKSNAKKKSEERPHLSDLRRGDPAAINLGREVGALAWRHAHLLTCSQQS